MATYDNLPVYRTSYDLLLELFILTKEFNREYKYTIGENIKKETLEMITNIYKANSVSDKVPYLRTARENIETIRLFIRLLKDLKQIGLERFVSVNVKVESVSKQLSAWQRSGMGAARYRRPESPVATAQASAPDISNDPLVRRTHQE